MCDAGLAILQREPRPADTDLIKNFVKPSENKKKTSRRPRQRRWHQRENRFSARALSVPLTFKHNSRTQLVQPLLVLLILVILNWQADRQQTSKPSNRNAMQSQAASQNQRKKSFS